MANTTKNEAELLSEEIARVTLLGVVAFAAAVLLYVYN